MSRRLADMVRELDTLDLVTGPRAPAPVADLRELLEAEAFGYFTFGPAGDLLALDFAGLAESAVRALQRGILGVDRIWGLFDPSAVPRAQRNRAVICQVTRFLRGGRGVQRRLGLTGPAYQRIRRAFEADVLPFCERHRLESTWNVRAVITDGAQMAGWTGATYAHVPRREHIRRFRALLPSLLRRAEIARDVARGRMGTALFEGALELLGRGCYLVAPGGRIVHANRAGAQALAAPELRTAIASATRLAAPPGHHVMEIESRGMRPMRLVVVEQSAVPELASVELTGRQREVAQLLCTGASNHQIADELGISERTVEVHLTRVYDRLGVQQRASAIARLLGRRR